MNESFVGKLVRLENKNWVKRARSASAGAVSAVFLVGCTLPSSEPMVPQAQVGVAAEISQGIVITSVPVTIEGDRTGVGSAGGAGVGGAGAVAATGGGGTEAIIAGAVGAVAGAVVGQAVEERVTRAQGQRVTIRMDDGRIIEVVQEAQEGIFMEGDRVNVAIGAGNTRVSMVTGIDTRSEASGEPAWYDLQEPTPYENPEPARISSQY